MREDDNQIHSEQMMVIGTSEIEGMIRELVKKTAEEMHDN